MFVSIEPDCSPPTYTQVSETIPGLSVSVMSVGLKQTFFRTDWDLLKASFFKVLFLMHSNQAQFFTRFITYCSTSAAKSGSRLTAGPKSQFFCPSQKQNNLFYDSQTP